MKINKDVVIDKARDAAHTAGVVAMYTGVIAIGVLVIAASIYSEAQPKTYSDVVRGIVNSGMCKCNQDKLIDMINRDGSAEYFANVLNVVNSDMFTGDKIDVIAKITE